MSISWSTDIRTAPHGRYEKCGKVLQSYYVPDEKRWMFLHHGEQPVAWMPWPEPYSKSPSQAAVVTDDHLREPVAAASGRIIRESGDAPQEASDGGNLSDTQFASSLPVPQSQAARPDALPLAGSGHHHSDTAGAA